MYYGTNTYPYNPIKQPRVKEIGQIIIKTQHAKSNQEKSQKKLHGSPDFVTEFIYGSLVSTTMYQKGYKLHRLLACSKYLLAVVHTTN